MALFVAGACADFGEWASLKVDLTFTYTHIILVPNTSFGIYFLNRIQYLLPYQSEILIF